MKTRENVLFEESDIPCLVILHFKKKSSEQYICLSVTMVRYTRYLVNQSGGGRLVLFTGLVSGCREVTVWGPSEGSSDLSNLFCIQGQRL